MKEVSDSEQPNTVVSMIEFRNKQLRDSKQSLFNKDYDVRDDLASDFELPTMNDWVDSLKELLDDPTKFASYNSTWTDPGDPELSCDDRDLTIPADEVERLHTILGVVDDALQSLYHCHAAITSDKLWVRAETIQKQIAAMVQWTKDQDKLRK